MVATGVLAQRAERRVHAAARRAGGEPLVADAVRVTDGSREH